MRIGTAVTDARSVTLPLRFGGDTTGLRVSWAGVITRLTLVPGATTAPVQHTFRNGGRKIVRVTVSGGAGAGCGTNRARSHTATRTIHVD